MSGWNGSGDFNLPYSWVADAAAGIDITASRMDTQFDTVSSNGFGNTLTRDGQGSATANLPMNGFRHTGAADSVNPGDYVTNNQMTAGSFAINIGTITCTTISSSNITAQSSTNVIESTVLGTDANISSFIATVGNTDQNLMGFFFGSTFVGKITTDGTNTQYITTSDYRLKVTYGSATGEIIGHIKVYEAAFKAKPDMHRSMVLAHELQEVAPFAVAGSKDAVDGTGAIIPQGVDYSALVPDIIAYVQRLESRLSVLEARG